jgi:periplasmic protein TonB
VHEETDVQRPGAATLHLLAIEPHRHALPAGIALSGLLHAAALGLRPPAPIESPVQLPLRATSFVVDVIDHDTPAVLTAPLAVSAPPPSPEVHVPPAPRAPVARVAPATPKAVIVPPSATVASEAAPAPTATSVSLPREAAVIAAPVSAVPVSAARTGNAVTGNSGTGTGAFTGTGTGSAGGVGSADAPSVSSGDAAGRARALAASRARYVNALLARIGEHKQYPYLARRQGLEGTVCVQVSLGARGQLIGLRVTCGSESEALMEAAKTAVTEAAPFEPLPPDLGTTLAVEVPIVFRLEEG